MRLVQVLECLACGVVLTRETGRCASCGSGAEALQLRAIEPVASGRQLALTAALVIGGVPLMVAGDHVAIWFLTTGAP